MAQIRIIGEPEQVEAVLRAMGQVVQLDDLSRRASRYNPADVRVYGHVAPLAAVDLTTTVVRADRGELPQ